MANSEVSKKKKKSSYKKTSNKTTKSHSKKKNTKNTKKNYPYSRNKKTTNTKKTQSAKTTSTKKTNSRVSKLDNNVSIKIDDTKEPLNYSILDENINNDYKKTKVQRSRKIKTDFNDDIVLKSLEDEELKVVVDDISNDVIDFDDETPAEIEEKEEIVKKEESEDKEASEEIEELENIITYNDDADEISKLIDELDKDEEEIAEELIDDSSKEDEKDEKVISYPFTDDEVEEVEETKEEPVEENNNRVITIPYALVKEYEESLSDVEEEEPIIKDNEEILTEEEILDNSTEDVDVLSIESDEDHSGVDESTSERIEAEDIHNVSMTANKDDIEESTKIIEDAFDDSKERAKEIYSHLDDDVVPTNSEDKSTRRFLLRLIILIIILILSIFFIINFSIKYINDSNVKDVNYYESSSIRYTLCNQGNCVEETEINGSIDSVSATFGYKAKFDEDISYNMNYSIVSLYEVIDPETKDVVFKDEENVLTKEIEAVKTDELKFSQDLDFSIAKFREELAKYNEGKDKTYLGTVKLIMYTSGINDKKQVASLNIPLQNDLLKKSVVSYNTGDATVTISNKSDTGVVYVCLMIISLSIVIGACIGLIVLLNTSSDDED